MSASFFEPCSQPNADILCSDIMRREFNPKLVDLHGKPRVEVSPKHPKRGEIRTTRSIWKEALFTRAVFSLKFDFGTNVPSENKNWLLEENPW